MEMILELIQTFLLFCLTYIIVKKEYLRKYKETSVSYTDREQLEEFTKQKFRHDIFPPRKLNENEEYIKSLAKDNAKSK